MTDRHTLGLSGRTGGEDHVGGVAGAQRRRPLGIGDRRAAGRGVGGQILHEQRRHRVRDHVGEVVAAGGQHQRRPGGVEDVVDAVGGLIRVERHVRATGLQHRVHRHDQLGRTTDAQRHQRFRADTRGHQVAGHPGGPLAQLAVGQLLVGVDQRDRVGGRLDLGVEQRHQRCRGHLVRGVVPVDEHPGVLLWREQIDVADRHVRVGHHGRQHPVQAARERRDRWLLEKIEGIGELGRHARGLAALVLRLLQGQLQVELGQPGVVIDAADRQAGQLQGGLLGVLERQHHLEQRMPGLRTSRVEHLDQPLERHVGVRERLQVGLAGLVQQVGEARRARHLGAQHQGVDEHADQVVEGGLTAAGDRGADGDVRGAARAGQQHRQRAVHDHEQRGVVAPAQLDQRALGLLGDHERVGAAPVGGGRRTRMVGGQDQFVGQIRQLAGPVPDLARDQRLRVVLGAEHLALPQRVIGVLHREFGPGRRLPGGARGVGQHHVAGQRHHRPAVGGDVVHDHAEHVLRLADLEQARVQRHFAGDVEGHRRQVDQVVDQRLLGDPVGGEVGHDLGGVEHHLHRAVFGLGEDRAQRLVPVDDVDDGDL
ncbi:hypothetical protein CJ469_02590 [Nocardia farcinica]|nr:hypothetical protein CJ469_02590 [Nocardia farcinica]